MDFSVIRYAFKPDELSIDWPSHGKVVGSYNVVGPEAAITLLSPAPDGTREGDDKLLRGAWKAAGRPV